MSDLPSTSNEPKKIKAGIFAHDHFVDTVYLHYLPRTGDYIQLFRQKYLAWKIESVVFLATAYQEWDVVLVINKSPLQEPTQELYFDTQQKIANERYREINNIRKDRECFHAPNEAWSRRKALYERVKAGESIEVIAEQENIKPARVKALSGDWRRLRARLRWHSDKMIDGQEFDVSSLDEVTP